MVTVAALPEPDAGVVVDMETQGVAHPNAVVPAARASVKTVCAIMTRTNFRDPFGIFGNQSPSSAASRVQKMAVANSPVRRAMLIQIGAKPSYERVAM